MVARKRRDRATIHVDGTELIYINEVLQNPEDAAVLSYDQLKSARFQVLMGLGRAHDKRPKDMTQIGMLEFKRKELGRLKNLAPLPVPAEQDEQSDVANNLLPSPT